MNIKLKNKLIETAKKKAPKNDPSHDINHALRVLALAEKISQKEKADENIIIPASLFHDIIVYQKNSSKSKEESGESAKYAKKILSDIKSYPKEKINKVELCIKQCSFSKGIQPKLLESKILQDADRLEATGAISIMRTFSSSGQMKRKFYDPDDPFCEKREASPFNYALDLFYERLLKVGKKMHTNAAKSMAKRRTKFLKDFLKELKLELKESNIK